MILRGPLARLVKLYLDKKYGYKDTHFVKCRKTCFAIRSDVLIELDNCDKRSVESVDLEVYEIKKSIRGPRAVVRAISYAVESLALARFKVYNDITKYIELYLVPLPEAPWVSRTLFYRGSIEIACHRDLQEFLNYLQGLGLRIPTDVFQLYERIHIFDSEFALFISSTIPKPSAIVEGTITIHGRGGRQRIALEASLTMRDLQRYGLSVGDKLKLVVYKD